MLCGIMVKFGRWHTFAVATKQVSLSRVPVAGDRIMVTNEDTEVVKDVTWDCTNDCIGECTPDVACERDVRPGLALDDYRFALRVWVAAMTAAGWEVTVHGDVD